eukprot:7429765-Pyramimonas_sp.AAC.1
MQQTGTNVQVDHGSDPHAPTKAINIMGPPNLCAQAEDMIRGIIAEAKQGRDMRRETQQSVTFVRQRHYCEKAVTRSSARVPERVDVSRVVSVRLPTDPLSTCRESCQFACRPFVD